MSPSEEMQGTCTSAGTAPSISVPERIWRSSIERGPGAHEENLSSDHRQSSASMLLETLDSTPVASRDQGLPVGRQNNHEAAQKDSLSVSRNSKPVSTQKCKPHLHSGQNEKLDVDMVDVEGLSRSFAKLKSGQPKAVRERASRLQL